MAHKYAIVEIDQIDIKSEREYGVIKLYGDFDYDFGIQMNTFGGRHYSFHDKITLTRPSPGSTLGILTITYANRDAYIDSNPKVQFTTVVNSLDTVRFEPDHVVFFDSGEKENCRLIKRP